MLLKIILTNLTAFVLFKLAESYQNRVLPLTVDKLRQDFLQLEVNLWNYILNKDSHSLSGEHLIREFERYGDQMQKKMPHDVTDGLKPLQKLSAWSKIYIQLRGIYALYENFRGFQKLQTTPNQQTWFDLIQVILNGSTPVLKIQENIMHFVVTENVFNKSLEKVEDDLCNTKQSPQQILFNLYRTIALTKLKTYMLMQFSYMFLHLYNIDDFVKQANYLKLKYENTTASITKFAKETMESASTEYWRCDPKIHIKGDTYIEITDFLQGYVQNEIDLNKDGNCRESCGIYSYTKSYSCYENSYCKQQRRCNGNILHCREINSKILVCPAKEDSGRRYEYIEYENGKFLGHEQSCSRKAIRAESWWRWFIWHCAYCFCLCDEESPHSDRFVSLRSAIADIRNNRVVTGLRFVKNKRIIHLQIQEGKLLPGGEIDRNTVRWLPVDDYSIFDEKIYRGQDYHTLTWRHRSIDLHDLFANEKYIITGVRFKMLGSNLNFEILTSPFNFAEGKLIDPVNRSIWKDNMNTGGASENPREQIDMNNKDVPIRSDVPSTPDPRSEAFLEFTETGMNQDASQTTVPFFDAQRVETSIPAPLIGAGIFYKGQEGFGGFIAPKVITYDFSKHLSTSP